MYVLLQFPTHISPDNYIASQYLNYFQFPYRFLQPIPLYIPIPYPLPYHTLIPLQALGYISAVLFGCSGAITYLTLVRHEERAKTKIKPPQLEAKEDRNIATLASIF